MRLHIRGEQLSEKRENQLTCRPLPSRIQRVCVLHPQSLGIALSEMIALVADE